MKMWFKKQRLRVALSLAVVLVLGGLSIGAADRYFEISKNVDIFISIYKEVDNLYVDELDHSKMVRTAIDAMLEDLDPYTVYISESEIQDFRFQTTGQYGGIGAIVGKRNGKMTVIEPYKGYAADKAGIKAGDMIITVDGKEISDKKVDEVSKALKGEPGTEVKLQIERPGEKELRQITFKREEVKVENVWYYGMVNDEVGYIAFKNFRQNATQEVMQAMQDLKTKGMKKLILDLRGNPGGLLNEAVSIVNLFVPKGQLVVSTRGKKPSSNLEYRTPKAPYDLDIPVAVLIDEGSASASEIVSGSLQDLDRGVVIGRKSYGKGLVQTTRPVSYNSQVKVTISKYYIPSGRCIQRIDYSHRDADGTVSDVPDSLISEFETRNGRKVYDGAGVSPDVLVERDTMPEVLAGIIRKGHVFNYATDFQYANDGIASPAEFELSPQQQSDFRSYLASKDFKFETKAEAKLHAFRKQAEEADYYVSLEPIYQQMEQELAQMKNKDLEKHKELINERLRLEIIKRYYYRAGFTEASLKSDEVVKEALEVLGDETRYNDILAGPK